MASESNKMNHEVHVVNYGNSQGLNPPPYMPGPSVTYNPAMGPTTVVVTQPVGGSKPTPLVCPSCRAQVVTRVDHKASAKTHIIAVILCLVFCPCVCIPYCVADCQNAEHYCPNCNSYLGTHKF